MRCYEQVPRRMIGELWLRTMARINSTRYIRDTCSTHTDRSIGNFFLDLLESDVLCPRIPGTLTELKKNERKREREKKKERKKKERGGKKRQESIHKSLRFIHCSKLVYGYALPKMEEIRVRRDQ